MICFQPLLGMMLYRDDVQGLGKMLGMMLEMMLGMMLYRQPHMQLMLT